MIGTDVAPKQCQDQFYILTVGLGPLADVVAGSPREACRAGEVQTSCDLNVRRSTRRCLQHESLESHKFYSIFPE